LARPAELGEGVGEGAAQRELGGVGVMDDGLRAQLRGGEVDRHARLVTVLREPHDVGLCRNVDTHGPTVLECEPRHGGEGPDRRCGTARGTPGAPAAEGSGRRVRSPCRVVQTSSTRASLSFMTITGVTTG